MAIIRLACLSHVLPLEPVFNMSRNARTFSAGLENRVTTKLPTKQISAKLMPLIGSLLCPKGEKNDKGPTGPSMYEIRKYGYELPANNVCQCFEVLCNIPSGIFRCTEGESRLGPCACKGGCYQNPEYFAYQHMSFYDINLSLSPCRQPSPKSNRKPP